ncbi:DUF4430 domain-containing protein [Anaerocolumna sp. AGMB13025]|uniref:DUF4430 domain-containing protein n=1 Tax=Anaerocolumna sp. AGMB13025 TaxID=3039116 RepID=UPI00241FF167|nr:DUF4430 domain-containing protein [Anaerocolumna sp. AGMB13025]WFR56141.1 DUF4430 domain-containing protein [Anaerocolumna sp. AGMB13025]
METKNTKKIVIGLLILIVIASVMTLLYYQFKPKTTLGSKSITVEVKLDDGTSKSFDIKTDEEYLRGALEQIGLISGDESEYGLFVKTVDGRTADDSKQEWWCFTSQGETINTSVDQTPIKDGDHFEITLTVGY